LKFGTLVDVQAYR